MADGQLRAEASVFQGADAAALMGLLLVLAARWWYLVFWPTPLVDEVVYLEAFRAVSDSASPYAVQGYFYSQGFACIGSHLLQQLGLIWVLFLLRAANLLGLCVTVWYSLSWWRGPRTHRFLIAAIFLSFAPSVKLSLIFGNISLLVIGLTLLALALWSTYPGVAGVFLGLSVGIKPLAPLAALALGLHRPRFEARAHWLAGGLGVLISLPMFLPFSRLFDMMNQPITGVSYYRTISLHRILGIGGLEVTPIGAAILLAVITVLACRFLTMNAADIVCVATTASVLATPVIWPHTLLLVLPVQVIAAERAWARRATGSSSSNRELSLVIIAIAAIQFFNSNGSEQVDLLAAPLQLVALGVPYLAPAALTTYIVITSRQTRASRSRRDLEEVDAKSFRVRQRTPVVQAPQVALQTWRTATGRSRLIPTSTRVIPRETSGTQSHGSSSPHLNLRIAGLPKGKLEL